MKWKKAKGKDPVRERKVKEVGHNGIAFSFQIHRGCHVICQSL